MIASAYNLQRISKLQIKVISLRIYMICRANKTLAEQSEYDGITEHENAGGTMEQHNNTKKTCQYRSTT